MNELMTIIEGRRLDVLFIQEPYQRPLAWPGFTVYTGVPPAAEIWAMTIVRNGPIRVVQIQDCCNSTCIVLRLSLGSSTVIAVNSYFKFADRIGDHIDRLEQVITRFRGESVLIAADANARSLLWHNEVTDAKGEELETFVLLHDIVIFNCPGEVSTFENSRGHKSNIDVTLGSGSLEQRIVGWTVHNEWSLSDHRLITYELLMTRVNTRCQENGDLSCRIKARDLDWGLLDACLLTDLGQLRDFDTMPLANKVDSLTGILRRAVEDSARHITRDKRLAAWWNRDLECSRSNKNRLEKRWKRYRSRLGVDHEQTIEARRLFANSRTEYVNKIRFAKKEQWLRIVRLSGESDPWGLAYKILSNKIKRPTKMVSMRSEMGLLTKPDEICRHFLGGLLPDDDVQSDNNENILIRQRAAAHEVIFEVVNVSPEELTKAVKLQKCGKAPGLDGIRTEIVKRSYDRIKLLLLDTLNAMFSTGEFPKIWKQGELRIFLKSEDRNPQIINSYRPVTLLPVLGKNSGAYHLSLIHI